MFSTVLDPSSVVIPATLAMYWCTGMGVCVWGERTFIGVGGGGALTPTTCMKGGGIPPWRNLRCRPALSQVHWGLPRFQSIQNWHSTVTTLNKCCWIVLHLCGSKFNYPAWSAEMAARETGFRGGRENATWSLLYWYMKVVLDISRQSNKATACPFLAVLC